MAHPNKNYIKTSFSCSNRYCLGLVLAAYLLGGCSTIVPAAYYRRPYAAVEATGFNIEIPTSEEITEFRDGINELTSSAGMDATWDAVLKASFWGGNVIRAVDTSPWNRRLLVSFHVMEYFEDPIFFAFTGQTSKHLGESWGTPNETWFAIDVTATNVGATHITATWINPQTMRPDDPHASEVTDDVSTRIRLTADRTRVDFLSAVALELDTARWAAFVKARSPSETYSSTLNLTSAPRPDWSSYATGIGAVDATMYRRHHFVVVGHPIEQHMNRILERLCDVAKCEKDMVPRAFLVANASETARSFANGEIYIGKSLLDRLESNDELAAVLAHELDHVVQYDGVARFETRHENSTNIRYRYLGVGAAAVALYAGYVAAVAPTETQARAVLYTLLGLSVLYFNVAADVGEQELSAYSSETELRADANAAILLRRAGFDPNAMLNVLKRERMWYE